METYTVLTLTLPVSTTPGREGQPRGMLSARTQSSLDTPRCGSPPTCQEGQVRTSQYLRVSDCHSESWMNSRPHMNKRETGIPPPPTHTHPTSQVSLSRPSLHLNPVGRGCGCPLKVLASALAKHLESTPANRLAAPHSLQHALRRLKLPPGGGIWLHLAPVREQNSPED